MTTSIFIAGVLVSLVVGLFFGATAGFAVAAVCAASKEQER